MRGGNLRAEAGITERTAAMKAAILAIGLLMATPAAALEYRNNPAPVPLPPSDVMAACMDAAAKAHRLPPQLLYLILRVEDGRLGRVTPNVSAPPDIGPSQVNGIWVKRAAERWGTTPERAFLALRDNFCANLEMAAYIARRALDDGTGDFWERFAGYHSRTPKHRDRYLRLLAGQAERLLPAKSP